LLKRIPNSMKGLDSYTVRAQRPGG
jgi:hypothetical protein